MPTSASRRREASHTPSPSTECFALPAERIPELSEDEALFQLLLRTPSIFSEFIRPWKEGEGFRLWPKQIIEINRPNLRKKRIQGRFLGKSITASDEFKLACILWTKPTGTALFATRYDKNLEPIFRNELVDMFKMVPFLRLFLPQGDSGINFKTFEIRLVNGVTIRGRIEGSGGSGMNTVHPNVIAWLDEVQMLSDEAVGEFYGMIAADLPLLASGVPNGVQASWGYRIDNDSKYSFVGGKMTRHDSPFYTKEMDEEMLEFYGGPTSSGYLNKVMGEWGSDARMTFDMDRIVMDLPDTDVAPTFYRSLELNGGDVSNSDGTPRTDVLAMRFAFRGDMPKASKVWFHADHGQSASPTTLYITFWDVEKKCWRSYHRILLRGMEAPTQAGVIHWLAEQIKKMTGIDPVIGMDTTGHGGSAVMALLQQHGHELVRVDVRAAVDTHETRLENDDEYRKRIAKDPFTTRERILVPIQQRWRQIAFPRLAREFYSGRLRLVNEKTLFKQLAGTTDYENKSGTERVYETDHAEDGVPYNHDLSAFEILGAMLHHLDVDQTPKAPSAWAQPINIGWGVQSAFGD